MAKTKNAKKTKAQQSRSNNNGNNNRQSTQRSGPSHLSAPTLHQQTRKGEQSEIVLQVRKGSQEIVIHPDNTRWLGEAAPSFQKWGMQDLRVWYEPRVATSTNGQVAMTFLSDYADLSPLTLEDTVTLAGAKRGNPWSRFELTKQRNRLFDYCSLSDFVTGDLITKNSRSPGRVVVYADMDAQFNDSDVVGWVYISYIPVLHEPILRRLQGGGSAGGRPGDGGHGGVYSDYYHHVNDYSNKNDCLGMNSELDPKRFIAMTSRIWYCYDTSHGQCLITNTSPQAVTIYITILLQDVTLLGSKRSITLNESGTHPFPGNKGLYAAWDNSDAWFKFAGVVEPNGFLTINQTGLEKWGNTEVFLLELGAEHGPVVVPERPVNISPSSNSITITSSWPAEVTSGVDGDSDTPSQPTPTPTPVSPVAGQSYDISTTLQGSNVRLYHELLNFGGNLYPWRVRRNGADTAFVLGQSTPNGDGYLDNLNGSWFWTDTLPYSTGVAFQPFNGGFVIRAAGSVAGWLAAPTSLVGDGSAYGGAQKSIKTVFSSSGDAADGIVWNFYKS